MEGREREGTRGTDAPSVAHVLGFAVAGGALGSDEGARGEAKEAQGLAARAVAAHHQFSVAITEIVLAVLPGVGASVLVSTYPDITTLHLVAGPTSAAIAACAAVMAAARCAAKVVFVVKFAGGESVDVTIAAVAAPIAVFTVAFIPREKTIRQDAMFPYLSMSF